MIDFIASVSPALRLALILCAIVAMMRLKVPYGWVFLIGAALAGLLFLMRPRAFASAMVHGVLSEETAFLIIMVSCILILSMILNQTGQTDRIIASFRAIVGPSRWTLVMFPALIGMLPMPGGAIFSAPMVEAAVRNTDISPARAAIANYWFRHIWEFWLPLYPGVILALTLTQAPIGGFILLALPMTFFALAAGYVIILRGVRLGEKQERDFSAANLWRFLAELTPILIVVSTFAFLLPVSDALLARALKAGWLAKDHLILRRIPLLLGLGLAIGWLFMRRGLTWRAVGGVLREKNLRTMLFMIVGLMAFSSVVKQCGAVGKLNDELNAWHVPLVAIVALLPFAAGAVIGVAFGFTGASFPFILPLLAFMPPEKRLPWYFLAYSMAYTGMMLTPSHTCLMMTIHYFKARVRDVYAYLAPLCASVAVAVFVLFYFYRAIF